MEVKVSVVEAPSNLSFAENHILLKLRSENVQLEQKTFLRICVTLRASYYSGETLVANSEFDYSIPVDNHGDAVFDVSSAISSMFSNVSYNPSGKRGGTGMVKYNFKIWDEYIGNGNEIVKSGELYFPNNSFKRAVAGGYTRRQRLYNPQELETDTNDRYIKLSDKPDGEMIPQGGVLFMPVLYRSTRRQMDDVWYRSQSEDGSEAVNTGVHLPLVKDEIVWSVVDFKDVEISRQWLFCNSTHPKTMVNVIRRDGKSVLFVFKNHYGALESIYCNGSKEHTAKIKSEIYSRYEGFSFVPSGGSVKHIHNMGHSIKMSTGPVSREWAEWFAGNLLSSEMVWMYDGEIDKYLPVTISAEESVKLYLEGKAELLDLGFTVEME